MPSNSALPMNVSAQRRNQNRSTSHSFQNAPRHICLVVHLPSIDYGMDVVFGVQFNHFPHPAMECAVAINSQEITAPQRFSMFLLNFFTLRGNRSTMRQSYTRPRSRTYCEATCHIQWCFGMKNGSSLLRAEATMYSV